METKQETPDLTELLGRIEELAQQLAKLHVEQAELQRDYETTLGKTITWETYFSGLLQIWSSNARKHAKEAALSLLRVYERISRDEWDEQVPFDKNQQARLFEGGANALQRIIVLCDEASEAAGPLSRWRSRIATHERIPAKTAE